MKVRHRLILLGAVVPVAALVALAVAAGLLLARRLHAELDDHLLAQAAVESVGLFDGPDGEPHLHAHRSPLRAELRGLIPVAAIYDRGGAVLVKTHDDDEVPGALRTEAPLGEVALRTTPAAARGRSTSPRRELISAVASPRGTRYTLYLAVGLDRLEQTMRRYWLTTGAAVAAIGALLLVVQLLLASRMARRIGALHAYLPRLREGQSDPPPPPDPSGDELAALRDGLHAAARQLERSRAERERGLADAAHDLRTPLGVIRTTIDLALRKPRGEAELRDALAEVRLECQRLTALTEEILAQRRGERRLEPVELGAVIAAARRGMAPLAAEADVELEAPAGGAAPVWLLGDATGLRRLLDNLLHNAITHSPRGGAISLTLTLGDTTARLTVRDQGPGIPADQLERVFQAFVRDDASRGAGLGLAIVRQIAAEHGGEAWAEPGPGGQLVVELPVMPSPP